MNPKDFTEHHDVIHLLEDLKKEFNGQGGIKVSDILDKEGNQYIDLVQEGGGVLGIALIGYLYVLEEMGVRFLNLAGTSAGSISTLLLAALGTPEKKKCHRLIEILANKDFNDFVDGDRDAKRVIEYAISGRHKFELILSGVQVIDNLTNDLGLNPGKHFHDWLTKLLKENGIETTRQLINQINSIPQGLFFRLNKKKKLDLKVEIKILTSDITTNSKVIFPEMGDLYYTNIEKSNPADFVRASMAIPIFFTPYRKRDIPTGKKQMLQWDERLKYRGDIPEEVLFVDGGIMSNFPIDVFHRYKDIPRKPTFGVKLGFDRTESNSITNPFSLLYSCFNSARQIRDFEFIFNNKEFEQLVENVDTDDYNWLNFNLTSDDKIGLFLNGAKAAVSFLKSFDWEKYKRFRENNLRRDVTEMIAKA